MFLLKVQGPRYYALLEIGFGIAFSASTLYKLQDQIRTADAAVLGTAIYLLIRGFDNFKKDLDERRKRKAKEPIQVTATSA